MEEMRLQKYLALSGVASRRACESLIEEGRVSVNGEKITKLGTKVKDGDTVLFDGKKVLPKEKKYYIMLNKPAGYVTTASDELGRKTAVDLLKDIDARVFPVGRLDMDTEGLLFLTNDGDFTYTVSHPKHKIEKTYVAHITGKLTRAEANMLKTGVEIDGRYTAPAKVEVTEEKKNSSVVKIKICEGRNRQVRKMFEAVGHHVISLKRTAVGGVFLGNLPLGKWRHLKEEEIKALIRHEK